MLYEVITVAADRRDVDGHMPDRLAGIEQEGDAGVARKTADRGGGVHQPAIGRHMGDRDELDPVVEPVGEGLDRDLARLVARDRLDFGAGGAGDLQIGDVVAGVFRLGGEDAVSYNFV